MRKWPRRTPGAALLISLRCSEIFFSSSIGESLKRKAPIEGRCSNKAAPCVQWIISGAGMQPEKTQMQATRQISSPYLRRHWQHSTVLPPAWLPPRGSRAENPGRRSAFSRGAGQAPETTARKKHRANTRRSSRQPPSEAAQQKASERISSTSPSLTATGSTSNKAAHRLARVARKGGKLLRRHAEGRERQPIHAAFLLQRV